MRNAAERVKNALELIPLFEDKVIPAAVVRTNQEPVSNEVSTEVTEVFEPELPVKEETQHSNTTEEIIAEETLVVNLAPETPTEKTQVAHYIPEATIEEAQDSNATQEMPTEETLVIEPVSESAAVEAQVTESLSRPTAAITQEFEPVLDAKKNIQQLLIATKQNLL